MDKDTSLLAGNLQKQNSPLPASLYHFFWKMMDWIYPPVCPGCETLGFRFCQNCLSDVKWIEHSICQKCGQPITNQGQQICKSCSENKPVFTMLRSIAIYDGAIRNAILNMKFHQDFGVSETLGQFLADFVIQMKWPLDIIIPVPLSAQRQKDRGFNQSFRLALPISLTSGIPIQTKALLRKINTKTQSDLPKPDRYDNVRNAFEADHLFIRNKTILLVDDVATTSSTINACSNALLDQGAKAVFGVTVARAVL